MSSPLNLIYNALPIFLLLSLQALSTLETVIKGGTVDANKYVRNQDITQIKFAVQAVKGRMKKKKPVSYFREFLPALIDRGYVKQSTKSSRHKYSVRK